LNFWEKLNNLSKLDISPHPNEIETLDVVHKNKDGYYHVCHKNSFNVYAADIKHSVPCLGYVICEDELPGKLDVSILKEKGVPPGPCYGKIKNGETIILDNGVTVSPEDCLGPKRPGRKVVILGDTSDANAISALAHGATVLVHEATNENADAEKSIAHGHSTAGVYIEFKI